MNFIQENCCFCIKELEANKVKIQDCGNDNITYISKLKSVFQDLIIPPHIYLPNSICSTCCECLNQAYKFKQQCFRSLNYWDALGMQEMTPQFCVETSMLKTEADPLSIETETNKQDLLNTKKVFTLKTEITVENDDGTQEHMQDNNLQLDPDKIYKDTCENNEYILNFGSHFISTTLTCDFCQTTCDNVEALKEHLKVHPEFRIYECETCGRIFSQEGRLKMHSLVHTDERNFECHICQNKYKTQHVLDRHMRQEHTKEKKINKCDLCGLICKTKSGLYYHTQKHKNPRIPKVKTIEERNYVRNISYQTKELLYPCEDCDKRFPDEKALNRHMRNHLQHKPHKCVICGKGFVQSSALKGHLSSHTDERNYKCLKCPKTFKSQGHLTTHMDIHLDRVHTCVVCNKTFSNLSSYYTHKKSHRQTKATEVRVTTVKDPPDNVVFVGPKLPYACEICPKSFFNHIQFRKHKQIHLLTKKFVCSNCGKSFITVGALKAHLLTHTKEKSYACDKCDKKFKTESTMKIHQKKVCKQTNRIEIKLEPTETDDSM